MCKNTGPEYYNPMRENRPTTKSKPIRANRTIAMTMRIFTANFTTPHKRNTIPMITRITTQNGMTNPNISISFHPPYNLVTISSLKIYLKKLYLTIRNKRKKDYSDIMCFYLLIGTMRSGVYPSLSFNRDNNIVIICW